METIYLSRLGGGVRPHTANFCLKTTFFLFCVLIVTIAWKTQKLSLIIKWFLGFKIVVGFERLLRYNQGGVGGPTLNGARR